MLYEIRFFFFKQIVVYSINETDWEETPQQIHRTQKTFQCVCARLRLRVRVTLSCHVPNV